MKQHETDFDRFWLIPAWMLGGLVALLLGLVVGFQIWAPGVVRHFNAVMAHSSDNTLIFDRGDALITAVEGLEDRHSVPIERISPYLQKAVVAAEDRRFFAHRGLDPVRLLGALWADLKAMAFEQGGSTITQQLVKLTLLSSERTLTRKAKELFMALALEQSFPKLKVLEFYMNRVYLGFGVYGVEKAAQAYFGVSAADVTLNQAAFLAALIKKPEGYLDVPEAEARADEPVLPLEHLGALMQRQRYILSVLRDLGWVGEDEYQAALAEDMVVFRPRPETTDAPYFVQQVLKQLRDELGFQRVSGRGLRVYTTLDQNDQATAERLVSGLREQTTEARQGALVSLDPRTGEVRSLAGGVDYNESQFNRATQAQRQPGSAFKPILYAAALENGFKTNAVFLDEPVRYISDDSGRVVRVYENDLEVGLPVAGDADEVSVYAPRNYDDHYGAVRSGGENPLDRRITLGRALELSSNVVAVQLLDRLGMDTLARTATRWGVPLRRGAGLCAALGCSEVSLLDLTTAYAAFANGGARVEPVFIRKVLNSQGEVLYEHYPAQPVEVISPWTAFQMRTLLGNVLRRGTGWRARLDRPAGGKTGTNDGPRDTWFIGFTPQLVTGVWMGNDDNRVMPSEVGGGTTARLWKAYMREALPPYAGEHFPEPPVDYAGVRICNVDGLPEGADCPMASVHYFRTENLPGGLFAHQPGTAGSDGAPADPAAHPGTGPEGQATPATDPAGTRVPGAEPAAMRPPPPPPPPPPAENLPGFSFFARDDARHSRTLLTGE